MLSDTTSRRARANGRGSALRSTVRDQLLAPANTLLQLVDLLFEEAGERTPPAFLADLGRMRAAAATLCRLVDDALPLVQADAGAGAAEAGVRHDVNTALNVLINYSEMLQEEAPGQFLDGFLEDLRTIQAYGKRCISLFNEVVGVRPADAPVADLAATPEEVAEVHRSVAPGRILVVDDLEDNRKILARLLEKQGHQVTLACNGREALDLLAVREFDLVFLDILMPVLNGFQVLAQLKAETGRPHVPVVVVSALEEMESVARCIQLGAADYLPKPFDRVLLQARTRACLEEKRLRDREQVHLRLIEAEQRRADELLHVILPAPIVRELKEAGTVRPRRHDDVAVLFADLVGFTAYSGRHPPEVVVAHLQALVESWEESGQRHGVLKIKTIGDAFMGAAGLLEPVENPVLRCLRCGAEMIDATRRSPAGWRLRVGVHVGPVVAGVLGKRQYLFDLWGDTVNVAARMESNSLADVVTLSEAAWQGVAPLSRGEPGVVDVAGKGAMTVWRFQGFRDA